MQLRAAFYRVSLTAKAKVLLSCKILGEEGYHLFQRTVPSLREQVSDTNEWFAGLGSTAHFGREHDINVELAIQ